MDIFANFINNGKCYLCEKKEDEVLCSRCYMKLEKSNSPEIINGIKVTSLYHYNQIASKILLLSKYPPYHFYILKYIINKSFITKSNKDSYLCPGPLSTLKMFERKFNQSEVIAKCLSKKTNSVVIDILKRNKDTKPLFNLDKESRQKEVNNSFRTSILSKTIFKKGSIKIIIVDDLITTGSTIKECFLALQKSGFKDIEAFSLFRA
jgi:competence protein ComFC